MFIQSEDTIHATSVTTDPLSHLATSDLYARPLRLGTSCSCLNYWILVAHTERSGYANLYVRGSGDEFISLDDICSKYSKVIAILYDQVS